LLFAAPSRSAPDDRARHVIRILDGIERLG
jgi:hypothetical protein